jgi:8-oxo-dGTP pyrophosphatase MutT (NUDIX family)
MTPTVSTEIVDVINDQNEVIGQVSKADAHRRGLLHRIVIAEVRDFSGRIVLVRQTPDRQDAGSLVSPVGGHVIAGESNDDALKREVYEEIGLTDFQYRLLGSFIFNRRTLGRQENHLFIVYLIKAGPADFILGAEADAIEVFTKAELTYALQTAPHRFGDAYHAVVQALFPELLPRTPIS